MAGQGADWVSVYLGGQYGYVRDGKPVFPEYRDAVHCAAEPFPPVPGLPLVVGVDYGLTPAAVFGQRTARGQWRICAELVAVDMGAAAFGEQMAGALAAWFPDVPSVQVWADPAGEARSQADERTAAEVLREKLGLPVRPAPTNALLARLEAVRAPLSRMVDGRAGAAHLAWLCAAQKGPSGRLLLSPDQDFGRALCRRARQEPT